MKKDLNLEIEAAQKKLADLRKKQRQQVKAEKAKAEQKAREAEIKLNAELIEVAKNYIFTNNGKSISIYEYLIELGAKH